jgi:hypothetical protein
MEQTWNFSKRNSKVCHWQTIVNFLKHFLKNATRSRAKRSGICSVVSGQYSESVKISGESLNGHLAEVSRIHRSADAEWSQRSHLSAWRLWHKTLLPIYRVNWRAYSFNWRYTLQESTNIVWDMSSEKPLNRAKTNSICSLGVEESDCKSVYGRCWSSGRAYDGLGAPSIPITKLWSFSLKEKVSENQLRFIRVQ